MNKNLPIGVFKDSVLHGKLKMQIIFFGIVFLFSIVTCMVFFFLERVHYKAPLLSFLLGLSFGVFTGHYKKMEWDDELGKVMNKFDWIGVLVIVVNIIYILFHKTIISEITQIQKITCISFALVCGNMMGRLALIFIRIKNIKRKHLERQSATPPSAF